jgi:hypothetical protein
MKYEFIEIDTKTNKNIEVPFQHIVKIKEINTINKMLIILLCNNNYLKLNMKN